MPHRITIILLVVGVFAVSPDLLSAEESLLTVESIMSRDWIGTFPEDPRWSEDGREIYFQKRKPGAPQIDLFRLRLPDGVPELVPDADRAKIDGADAAYSRDRRLKAFVRNGDVFLRDVSRGTVRQLTRGGEAASDPLVLADGRVAFRRGDDWDAVDPATGGISTLVAIRFAKDPEDKEPPKGFLAEEERRLLEITALRDDRDKSKRERARALRLADPTRGARPFFLGEKKKLEAAALSPDGRHLLAAVVSEEAGKDKRDRMPVWVNGTGDVDVENVRPKVGVPKTETPQILLLDLAAHTSTEISLADLPGLHDDPLKELREKAAEAKKTAAKEAAAKEPSTAATPAKASTTKSDESEKEKAAFTRAVDLGTGEEDNISILWSEDGGRVAFALFSADHKDRWTVTVDAATTKLAVVDRLTDPAWINYGFNDLGWLKDGKTVWLLSEESGRSHLYLVDAGGGTKRALTRGAFEVDHPILARDGRSFLVVANRESPGVREIYRVRLDGGEPERLTKLGGDVVAVPSPDDRQLALLASNIATPPDLYLQAARAGATAKRLTHSTTKEFDATTWVVPQLVEVPSRHNAPAAIWSRLYLPPGWTKDGHYPAAVFIHGAGYLQEAYAGWSYYWREFMFNTLLARRGYVVLAMDYRGSAGYGRDWRTAIYRQMGHPEVEDLVDGVAWLAETKGVDRTRVGTYGGSYGGFLTLMSMFREPDLFACGAALRPVSDWAEYNDLYTADILNTPDVDPEAYKTSSPIEFVDGLKKPLLICHGMVDDNVLFVDTVRLVERLIERKKTPFFETAIFPIEPHSFREPWSWTDEYTRILELFERNLER